MYTMRIILVLLELTLLTELCKAQTTATVVSSPAGDGSNGFPISTALNLTCVITPTPGDGVSVSYEWVETCSRDGGSPPCFGSGALTTATIGTSRLQPYDSGTYECRPVVDGLMVFSGPFTVRVTGAVLETGEDKSAMNIGNYTFYYDDDVPPVIYCKSGLSGNTSSLGGWFFNDQPIGNDPVNCPASTSFAAETPSSSNPGVLPLVQCSGFGGFQLHLQSEGLYTCRIMDIDFQLHVFQVGIYFRRGAPSLSGPFIPDANYTIGVTLNVGCLANGPPPDQFFMTRNGVVIDDSYNTIEYSASSGQFFIQHPIPSLSPDDYGVYTCTYVIPVFSGGSRSNSIPLGGPTISPPNFAATSITSESFTLSWTPIPGFQPGGLQEGYDITCNPGNDLIEVNGSVSSVAVTGLLSYTMYSCTIFGYSQIVGPVSDPLSITTLQAAPSEPQSFGVTVLNSSAVSVSWETPAMINGILSHYTLYYTVGGVVNSLTLTSIGAMTQTHIIADLQPYQEISANISATTGGGEGPSTTSMTVRTLADLPSHVASLQVTQQSDTLSTVQWTPPLYPNGMITNYRLIITRPDDVIPTDFTVDDVRSYPLQNLEPGILYEVLVMAVNDEGSGPSVREVFYGSQLTPTTAPRNVTVKRFIDGIFVSWNELLASESRGNPTYVVQYQSTMSGSSAQTVHTSEKFAVIENLVSDETYTVSVAAAVNASGGLMTGPSSSSVMAPSSGTGPTCSGGGGGSDCTAMLGVAVVFIVLFIICLIALLILIFYQWRQWKKDKEDHESQTNLTKTAFEFASRENFHLHSNQASIGVPRTQLLKQQEQQQQQQQSQPKPPPPRVSESVKGVRPPSDVNIYETIDKRVKANQMKMKAAADQRASTGTAYESIDRKQKPTTAAPVNQYSLPKSKSKDQDVSDPYTIDATLERQRNKIITDIYADSLVTSTNRESLNLEMFTPGSDMDWQTPQGGQPTSTNDGGMNDANNTGGNKTKPEDKVSLID